MENNTKKNESKTNLKAINWSDKRFGLLKVPSHVLLKNCQEELDKANGRIQELETVIKQQNMLIQQLKNGENKEIRQKVRKTELYQLKNNEIKKLRKINYELRETLYATIARLNTTLNNGHCA